MLIDDIIFVIHMIMRYIDYVIQLSNHLCLPNTPCVQIEPSPCPWMMLSNIWKDYGLLDCGTWCEAPLNMIKITPE